MVVTSASPRPEQFGGKLLARVVACLPSAVAQHMESYGALIAANLRSESRRLGITQASCARRMRDLGFEWHQQTVGNVERVERRLSAEEILGLSVALVTTIDALTMGQWTASVSPCRPDMLSGCPQPVPAPVK